MTRPRRKPSLPGKLRAIDIVGAETSEAISDFAKQVEADGEAAKARQIPHRPKRQAHDQHSGAAHADLKRAAKRVRDAETARARLAASGAPSKQITQADAEIRLARQSLARRQEAKAEIVRRSEAVRTDRLALLATRNEQITLRHLEIADGFRGLINGHARPEKANDAEIEAKRAEVFHTCRTCQNVRACMADNACRGASGVIEFTRALDRWKTARRTTDAKGRPIAPPPMFDPKPIKRVRRADDGGLANMVYWNAKRMRTMERFDKAAIGAAMAVWPKGRKGETQATVRAAGEMASVGALEVILLNKGVDEVISGWGIRKTLRRNLMISSITSGLLAVAKDVGC